MPLPVARTSGEQLLEKPKPCSSLFQHLQRAKTPLSTLVAFGDVGGD